MTFIEAAIEILQQVGRPLAVRELTERAIKLGLLSHTGRAPEATMQTRLAQEVKKGERTPLVQKSPGTFGLRRYERTAAKPAAKAKSVAAKPVAPAKPKVEAEAPKEEDGEPKKRRRRRRGKGKGEEGAEVKETTPQTVEDGTPEEAILAEKLSEEEAPTPAPEPPTAPMVVGDSGPLAAPPVDLDALRPVEARRYPRVVELPAEEALAAEYADEIAAGSVALATATEVIDHQSADEDRPLLAEIKDERDRDRRGRRGRRDRDRKKDKHDKPEHKQEHRAEPKQEHRHEHRKEQRPQHPPVAASPAPTAAPPPSQPRLAPVAAGTSVADIAVGLLKSLNDGRPTHARQLAAMAVKRKLLAGDPEELWRIVRGALAADSRERQALGLRPRVKGQGMASGLFVLASAKLDDAVRTAEEAVDASIAALGRVTREALRAAVGRLAVPAFEQVARLHLERSGFRDIERVKRTNETSYFVAVHPRGKFLVGARAGAGEVGRHAVGELRAGVESKGCGFGLLLAAGRLGGDGARELAAAGGTVTALVGDDLADALFAAGIGVVRAAAPVAYLDLDFLAELSSDA